jgi:hypothetical protein
MNTKDAIRETLNLSHTVLTSYMKDLSDADLLKRPGDGCTNLAYQLGHLISSECGLLNGIRAGAAPELPAGFQEKHSKGNVASDNPADFLTKQQYLELTEKVHAATLATLEAFPDADFDKPAPESFRKMFPTMGSMFILIATHPMMHAGQFVPVRRALGKPIVI